MKKVLFVTYGGGHAKMVIAVAKQLMVRPYVEVNVLGLTTARKVVEKEGIPCFSCRDLDISPIAAEYGETLLASLGGGHPDVPDEESKAYLGLSYECLVLEHGATKAEELYEQLGRQAFLPIQLMETVIRDGSYDLVVATNSPRFERAAIEAAGNVGVPSICMVDLFALQEIEWIGQTGYADKVCVLSSEVKELFLAAGRLDDEIAVTGNPAFDYLGDRDLLDKGRYLREFKGWGNDKVILWCSQIEPELHPFNGLRGDPTLPMSIETALQLCCSRNTDLRLYVRPHPNEDMKRRQRLDGVEYGTEDDLGALLSAVDLVVVMSSTVGLEAAFLRKPVVALNMSIFSDDMPFAQMSLAEGVDDLDDLCKTVDKVLMNDGYDWADLPPAGSASRNVCQIIASLW